ERSIGHDRFVWIFRLEPHLRHFRARELESRRSGLHARRIEATFLQNRPAVALHEKNTRAARAVALVDDERSGDDAFPICGQTGGGKFRVRRKRAISEDAEQSLDVEIWL